MNQILDFAGPFFWFLVALEAVFLSHLAGRFIFAKLVGLQLSRVKIGIGAQLFFKNSNNSLQISYFPIGGSLEFSNSFGHDKDFPTPIWKIVGSNLGGPIFQFIVATFLLSISFSYFGYTTFTMQVVNTAQGSPAQRAGLKPGDVILGIAGREVQGFEDGQRLISAHANKLTRFLIERRESYKTFDELQPLMAFLENSYEERAHIKIHSREKSEPSLFYAKKPALELLQKISLKDLKVEISTAVRTYEVDIIPDQNGKIGIGIKPYSLTEKKVYPGLEMALPLACRYTWIICEELLSKVYHLLIHAISSGVESLEINLFFELKNFMADISLGEIGEILRFASMILIVVGTLNILPLPRSVGFNLLLLLVKKCINFYGEIFLKSSDDILDDDHERYLRWLFDAAFGFILILLIFFSFQPVGRL